MKAIDGKRSLSIPFGDPCRPAAEGFQAAPSIDRGGPLHPPAKKAGERPKGKARPPLPGALRGINGNHVKFVDEPITVVLRPQRAGGDAFLAPPRWEQSDTVCLPAFFDARLGDLSGLPFPYSRAGCSSPGFRFIEEFRVFFLRQSLDI